MYPGNNGIGQHAVVHIASLCSTEPTDKIAIERRIFIGGIVTRWDPRKISSSFIAADPSSAVVLACLPALIFCLLLLFRQSWSKARSDSVFSSKRIIPLIMARLFSQTTLPCGIRRPHNVKRDLVYTGRKLSFVSRAQHETLKWKGGVLPKSWY